jgi:hypothetical protein
MPDSRAKMMQLSPRQCQDDQLDEPLGCDIFQIIEGILRQQTLLQQIQNEWQQQEQQQAANTMQYRNHAGQWHPVIRQIQYMDIAKFRPTFLHVVRHN